MQVYRELRILTARPTPQDEAKAPHALYGVMPVSEACSAGRWLDLARAAIDKAHADGKLPVVTGGTGLYIKSLMEGLSAIPQVTEAARTEARALWEKEGPAALRARDSHMERHLRPTDKQRHIRALAVLLATGKSLTYWRLFERKRPYGNVRFETEVVDVPREELYRRCDARFLTMMHEGALEEARALMQMNLSPDLPAMRALGVPELIAHLKGELSLDEAINKAQQMTRNYAKRQLTWFRHQLKPL